MQRGFILWLGPGFAFGASFCCWGLVLLLGPRFAVEWGASFCSWGLVLQLRGFDPGFVGSLILQFRGFDPHSRTPALVKVKFLIQINERLAVQESSAHSLAQTKRNSY
jgi:hypothetical protein